MQGRTSSAAWLARLVGLWCALLTATGACAAVPPGLLPRTEVRSTSSGRSQVEEILDRRTAAVSQGSEQRFLADVDPQKLALGEQQRMLFANLRQIPFQVFRYHRVSSAVPADPQEGASVQVLVQLTFAIDGVDGAATGVPYVYTFLRRGDRLLLSGIDPGSSSGLRYQLPWDEIAVHVTRAGSALLVADPSVPDAAQLGAQAAAAGDQVRRLWGQRPGLPGFLVFLTANEQRFKQWFGSVRATEPAGVEFPVPPAAGAGPSPASAPSAVSAAYVASRIALNMTSIDWDSVGVVLRHEFAHAIAVPIQVEQPPTWAEEGFARWVEAGGSQDLQRRQVQLVTGAVSAGRFTGELPLDTSFYGENEALNYALGYTVFRFVADRWGEARAVELFAQTIGPHSLDDAARAALGVSSSALLQQWRGYVRQLRA